MTEVQTSPEVEVPAEVKVSVSDRKAIATGLFTAGTDATSAAVAFANVPNGREFLDTVYNAAVTAIATDPANLADPAGLAGLLAAPAEFRTAVAAGLVALVPEKSVRPVADPVAVRSALIEKVAHLTAIRDHLDTVALSVTDKLTEVTPDDITDDEQKTIDGLFAPANVTAATDRIAKAVEKLLTGKVTSSGDGTRSTVAHVAPAVGTVLTHGTDTVEVVAGTEAGKVAYKVTATGKVFTSISAAAKDIAGGERNGWEFFGI